MARSTQIPRWRARGSSIGELALVHGVGLRRLVRSVWRDVRKEWPWPLGAALLHTFLDPGQCGILDRCCHVRRVVHSRLFAVVRKRVAEIFALVHYHEISYEPEREASK